MLIQLEVSTARKRHAWHIISAQMWKNPSPIRSQPKNNWTAFLLDQLGSVSTHRFLRAAGRHILGKHSCQPLKEGWWVRLSRGSGRNGGLDSSWWRPHPQPRPRLVEEKCRSAGMADSTLGKCEPTMKEMVVQSVSQAHSPSDSSTASGRHP